MKNNLKNIFGLARFGAGAAVLGLLACASTLHAAVIVDNTGTPNFYVGGATYGQLFTMSGTSFNSLTLELYSASGGTANVSLYNVGSGLPTSLNTLLGTVTAGVGDGQLVSVTPFSVSGLTSGNQYAIVLSQSSSVRWDWNSTAATGFGATASSADSGATWSSYPSYVQMNLSAVTPVPEVPMTGMVMGFGALTVAMVSTRFRKIHSAGSSIG